MMVGEQNIERWCMRKVLYVVVGLSATALLFLYPYTYPHVLTTNKPVVETGTLKIE